MSSREEGWSNVRRLIGIAIVTACLASGCQTDKSNKDDFPIIKAASQAAAKNGTVFLKVFLDEAARAKAPVDVQVAIDDKPLINRTFMLVGRDNPDGQYQITLPKGTHTLTALSNRGRVQVQKNFRVKGEHFIELYVTDNGWLRLTPESRRRILRFVIKNYRKPQTKTFNPAMWMRLSSAVADEPMEMEERPLVRYAPESATVLPMVGITTAETYG